MAGQRDTIIAASIYLLFSFAAAKKVADNKGNFARKMILITEPKEEGLTTSSLFCCFIKLITEMARENHREETVVGERSRVLNLTFKVSF